MKYILSLFTFCFSLSAYSTHLNFENQPTVAFHIESNIEVTGNSLVVISASESAEESVDFDLTLYSPDEAIVTIHSYNYAEKWDGNFFFNLIHLQAPESIKAKLLQEASNNLLNVPLHFKRDSDGKMKETTGLLADVEARLFLFNYELIGATAQFFDDFFKELLHLKGEELKQNREYSAKINFDSVENDDYKEITGHYLITNIDQDLIKGTFEAQDTTATSKSNIKLLVTWDPLFSVVQQRTIKATQELTIPEEWGTTHITANIYQKWKSKIK